MNVQLCVCNKAEYLVVDPSHLRLTFKKEGLGILSTTDHPNACENDRLFVLEPKDGRMAHVNALIITYTKNIFEMCGKLGIKIDPNFAFIVSEIYRKEKINRETQARLRIEVSENTIPCFRNFKATFGQVRLGEAATLNLSGLGIATLPFIDAFKGVRRLNLANNNLVVLPEELDLLKDLEEIDLRGNKIWQWKLPKRIQQLKDQGKIRVLWDKIEPNRDDWCQSFFSSN